MKLRLIACIAVAAALIGGLAPTLLHAEEPSPGTLAAAKEYIALKGGGSMFDKLIPGVIESVKNSLIPTNPNLIRELNEVAEQLHKELAGKRAELDAKLTKVYARHFTEQELKDVISFYKTPVGSKLLTEEPAVVEESLKEAQSWADDFSEQVMSRFRAEMKKRGHLL